MHRIVRLIVGGALWGLGLIALGRFLVEARGTGSTTAGQLGRYFRTAEARLDVEFPYPVRIEVGDDVELGDAVVGEVEAILDPRGAVLPLLYERDATRVRARLYGEARQGLRQGASATLVIVPQTAEWVVETLFTRENIPRLAEEWNRTMLAHREEIFTRMTPIVRDLILEVERHIAAELPAFLEAHRAEVGALGESMKARFGPERFSRLFEQQVWPIAQPKLRPIIESLSREIWKKLPLWGFSWRIAYQTLPGTDNDHFQKHWVEFLESQVVPAILSHTDEILGATREIVKESLARDEVSSIVKEAFTEVLADPRFHALVQAFLREVFLDNERFHHAMLARWRSADVQSALAAASVHIEPMARRMGDILLGTREAGITREFAKVLRTQILWKDKQRLVIDPGPNGAPPLPLGAAIPARVEVEHPR